MKRITYLFILPLIFLNLGFIFTGWKGLVTEGINNLEAKKFDQAITAFNEALIDRPHQPEIHYNLGNALYYKNDFTRAKDHYLKVLNLSSDEKLKTNTEYNLGNLEYRIGESLSGKNPQMALNHLEMALQHYEKVIRENPLDEDAKYNYEFVKKKLKELKNNQNTPEQGGQGADKNNKDKNEDQTSNNNKQSPEKNQSNSKQQEQKSDSTNSNRGKEENGEKKSGQNAQENIQKIDSNQTERKDGLTEEEALQLLEQFRGEYSQLIPFQADKVESLPVDKDW